MLKSLAIAFAFVASALALPALAHDYTLGNLQIIHPFIPAPAANAKVAGGFLSIANNGAEEDKLLSVRADFATAEIHKSEIDASGIATMAKQEFLAVPANGAAVLEHGGLHIMFMGLTKPLEEGASAPVTLVFEKAGEITVDFMVEAPDSTGGEDMGGHSMHTTNP